MKLIKTQKILIFLSLTFCSNVFAESLFVSVPLESLYDSKYALGVGYTQDLDRVKLEYGQQQNSGNYKNNHSKNATWTKYTFTKASYFRKIPQILDIEVGTGLDKLILKENSSRELEELNTRITIAKTFQSKNLEIMPSLTYDIPLSDKDQLYSKHLTRNIKLNLDLNYIF